MKQKPIGETDKSAIGVQDFNTFLSINDWTSRQEITKEIEDLSNANWPNWNLCCIQQQQNAYSFQETFTKTDHIPHAMNKSELIKNDSTHAKYVLWLQWN